jgi:hypothetical protein
VGKGAAEASHVNVTFPADAETANPNAAPNAQITVDNAFIVHHSLSFDEGLFL